ncbi:hypothetical protein CLV28_1021 [Sediminihabitans luteus]|uniref:Uncharacterized protein n=1 Tax=Sediminihabitans luteus TaxID=1138585 RepID=A0A2M9D134_9CELL|nr:hypothetical protein [Sediminihabitans luteus]PJJ77795.1 hypothetical protein CLV28_1021 [Sediminihabitans luteus]GII99847.1 hypothetical protein Slu03_22250 [Sediminihabitans luteus]
MSLPGEFIKADLKYHEEHLRSDLHRGEGPILHWVRAHTPHRGGRGTGVR